MSNNPVLTAALALDGELRQWRQHLHSYPELSFQEFETAKFLENLLQSWGLAPKRLGTTGLVLDLNSERKGPFRALRADIDALPIQEQVQHLPFISKNPNCMHACGHDAHTACLLGAIRLLLQFKHRWSGSVRCIFQPAEEKLPGGASILLAQGLFADQAPQAIFGQHIEPQLKAGKIGLCPGPFMAGADELYLEIRGRGGHGARPQDCQDTVLAAAQVLLQLQQVVSRWNDPLEPLVLSFGHIASEGGATNILPEKVQLAGTLRYFSPKAGERARAGIRRLLKGLALSLDLELNLTLIQGYPPVVNQPALFEKVKTKVETLLGHEAVVLLGPRMGAEDFGFYAQAYPASFHRLGCWKEGSGGLHSPFLDLDEACLSIGAAMMAYCIMD